VNAAAVDADGDGSIDPILLFPGERYDGPTFDVAGEALMDCFSVEPDDDDLEEPDIELRFAPPGIAAFIIETPDGEELRHTIDPREHPNSEVIGLTPGQTNLYVKINGANCLGGNNDLVPFEVYDIEAVEYDPDYGITPAGWLLEQEDFVPELEAEISNVEVTADSVLVTIVGRYRDGLSELADEPSLRMQSLIFNVNGEEASRIDGVPSRTSGSPGPFRLHTLAGDFEHVVAISLLKNGAVAPLGTYAIEVRTSPNAVGRFASERLAIDITYEPTDGPIATAFVKDDDESDPPGMEPDYYAIRAEARQSHEPEHEGAFGAPLNRYAFRIVGLDVEQLQFSVSTDFSVDAMPLQFASLNLGDGEYTYLVVEQGDDTPWLYVPSLEFSLLPPGVADSSMPGGSILIPDERTTLVIEFAGESVTGGIAFYTDGELPRTHSLSPVGLPQDDSESLSDLELVINLYRFLYYDEENQHDNRFWKAHERVLEAFNPIYVDKHESEDTGCRILFEDMWFKDSVCCYHPDTDTVSIKLDPDLEPSQAAEHLFRQLRRSLKYDRVLRSLWVAGDPAAEQLLHDRLAVRWTEMRQTVSAMTRAYLEGLAMISIGADLVLTLDDLSKGNYYAAVNVVSFVPSSASQVVIKAPVAMGGGVLASMSRPVVDIVQRANGIRTFRGRLTHLRNHELELADDQIQVLVRSDFLKPPAKKDAWILRSRMHEVGRPNPPHAAPQGGKWQLHHELPNELREDFAEWLFDVNDPSYGKWVVHIKGRNSPSTHLNWSREWTREWREFLLDLNRRGPRVEVGRQEILLQLDRMRDAYGPMGRYKTFNKDDGF
jgi:hypothetical protein